MNEDEQNTFKLKFDVGMGPLKKSIKDDKYF